LPVAWYGHLAFMGNPPARFNVIIKGKQSVQQGVLVSVS
jgi:hypothetical protein